MEKLAICFLCLFSLQVNLVYFLFFLFTASGPLHCEINNGGCWKKTQDGRTYSARVVSCPCINMLKVAFDLFRETLL